MKSKIITYSAFLEMAKFLVQSTEQYVIRVDEKHYSIEHGGYLFLHEKIKFEKK